MRAITCAGILSLCVFWAFADAVTGAEPSSDVASAQIPERRWILYSNDASWARRDTWPSAIAMDLTKLYGVPVHSEKITRDEKGMAVDIPPRKYQVPRDQSLEGALDEIVSTWPEMCNWTQVRRSFVIKHGPQDSLENLLDTPITVELEDLSVWDAVKQVIYAIVQASPRAGRFFVNIPGPDRGLAPPAELTAAGAVTLKVNNVAAREALVAIFETTPALTCYSYFVQDKPELTAIIDIFFFPQIETPITIRQQNLEAIPLTPKDRAYWDSERWVR